MKQGKTAIFPMFIVAMLCIIAVILGVILGIKTYTTEEKIDSGVFDACRIEQLEEQGFVIDLNGNYKLENAEEFGFKGEVEAGIKDDSISSIAFNAVLSESDNLEANEAEKKVSEFVRAYSDRYGFPVIEEPKIIQFADDESYKECPEHLYEALVRGFVLFEYSYRDTNGILWIAQIYSPKYNLLCGNIIKYPDMSGFVEYEPQINLQKEVLE